VLAVAAGLNAAITAAFSVAPLNVHVGLIALVLESTRYADAATAAARPQFLLCAVNELLMITDVQVTVLSESPATVNSTSPATAGVSEPGCTVLVAEFPPEELVSYTPPVVSVPLKALTAMIEF
jgi:hypothetical protein